MQIMQINNNITFISYKLDGNMIGRKILFFLVQFASFLDGIAAQLSDRESLGHLFEALCDLVFFK